MNNKIIRILVISLLTLSSSSLFLPSQSYACGGDGKSCSCMMDKSEGGQCGSGCGCNKGKKKLKNTGE
jgi:hypothetical protein